MSRLAAAAASPLDTGSRDWLRDLRSDGAAHRAAVARLHALLLRAARFETARRRGNAAHVPDELEEIANEAAADALDSVLTRLDDFRGESRFTTWAYKFAVLETAVKLRKRDWQGRELPVEPDASKLFAGIGLQSGELSEVLGIAIDGVLTEDERRVLVALALQQVPIDVLADRLDSTRAALYDTLHDARLKLRAHLAAFGHPARAG